MRHWVFHAASSALTLAVRHVSGVVLDGALSHVTPPQRHRNLWRTEGTTLEVGVQREATKYTRVAARMITTLQKLVITARQSTTEDPFAEAANGKPADNHLWAKAVLNNEQSFSGVSRNRRRSDQNQRVNRLGWKRVDHHEQEMLNQSPTGRTKRMLTRMRRETKTPSLVCWVSTPKRLAREDECGYCVSTSATWVVLHGARYRLSSIRSHLQSHRSKKGAEAVSDVSDGAHTSSSTTGAACEP